MSAVSQEATNYEVYLGVWTNWSRGRTHGGTITTTTRDGALLIAFLALYVQLVGQRFWRLICFAFHQLYSSPTYQDGYYHQRQSILRNAGTDFTGSLELVRIAWAWRGRTTRPILRTLPLIFAALMQIAAFTAAGIFSSLVSQAPGNEVLVSDVHGGFLNGTTNASLDEELTYITPYSSELAQSASSYSQSCYTESRPSQTCSIYARPYLASTSQNNMSCPFGDNICLNDDDTIQLDTGHMNSQLHFGINRPPEDRWTWRMVTTCSVLKSDEFTKSVPDHRFNISKFPVNEYWYGQQWGLVNETYTVAVNYTYVWETALDYTSGLRDYRIQVNGFFNATGDWWTPLPQLQLDDADTFIFFLSASGVQFSSPVEDPWYSATTLDPGGSGFYLRDKPVSVMSCAAQYQFCNPNLPEETGCFPLSGIYGFVENLINAAPDFWSSAGQETSASLFNNILTDFMAVDMSQFVADLSAESLLARNGLTAGTQGPLGPKQWQEEVTHWHNSTLALLQRLLVEQATGPSDPGVERYQQQVDEDNPVVCQPQLIRTSAYTSFSILGMSLILGIGGLIIIISFCIEPYVGWLQRKAGSQSYKRAEWLTQQKFQTQRIAFENSGSGRWTGALDMIPTTKRNELLAPLDLKDRLHPTFTKIHKVGERDSRESELQAAKSPYNLSLLHHPTTPISMEEMMQPYYDRGIDLEESPYFDNGYHGVIH